MKKLTEALLLKGLWKIKPIHVVLFLLFMAYQAWMGSPYFMYYVVGAPEPGTAPRYVGKLRVEGELQRTRDGWIPPRYFVETEQGDVEFHCGYLPYKRECFPLGDDKRIEPEGVTVAGYTGKPVHFLKEPEAEEMKELQSELTAAFAVHRLSGLPDIEPPFVPTFEVKEI